MHAGPAQTWTRQPGMSTDRQQLQAHGAVRSPSDGQMQGQGRASCTEDIGAPQHRGVAMGAGVEEELSGRPGPACGGQQPVLRLRALC